MNRPLISLLGVVAASVSAFAATTVDYLHEVKPVLADYCYRCHGASQQKRGLRLDTAAFAIQGGESGPALKPGKGVDSLILQAVKGTHDRISRMPYKKPPLSDAQIVLLEKWIDQGARAPADEEPEKQVHWAFVSPTPPPVPATNHRAARNPIDHFILARLEREKVAPSPEAERVTLLRRLSLDLTGLPPTVAEVDAFAKDRSPDAYEKVVERLLASPHYGERWGRWWLDVARYADSNGYSIDAPRSIWKYRDWVIDALNRDLPFDQFVIEQLAGDLLPDATLDQKIATGFNRNTQINQEGGIDPEQFRVESVMDRVNTTATAFLGVTLACAQCHDHKFDPFTQREYYQFYAFFNNTVEDGHGKSAPEGMLEIPGESEAADHRQKEREEAEADLERYLNTKGNEVLAWEQSLTPAEQDQLKPEAGKALKIAFAERTTKQKRTLYAAFRPDDAEFKQRNTRLTKLEKNQPKPVTTLVMVEQAKPRETTVFIKGDFTRSGAKVTSGVPAILNSSGRATGSLARPHPGPLPHEREKTSAASDPGTNAPTRLPNRLDLARWIVETNNPLTARVLVNRVWQQYFGRGLVETENDFGTQGSLSSHPELLDWLACEFMHPEPLNVGSSTLNVQRSSPWSLKHLHRLIVTSSVYRQSSKARPDLAVIDPNNRLLARQSRLRLDAEIVRDAALSASGLLNGKIGGPSVFPPQPDGVMNLGQSKRDWKPSTGADRYRRGLYTFFWRATPHPALMVFDSADGFSTCTRRARSNTPLQALTLLNDEAFQEFAQALAARVVKEGGSNDSDRMTFAFRLCLSRPPADGEKQRLLELLRKETDALEKSPQDAKALLASPPDSEAKSIQLAAWTTIARVLLNLDETITRE